MTNNNKNNNVLTSSKIYEALKVLDESLLTVNYKYMEEEGFSKLESVQDLQQIYWSEIIQRLHVFSCTSVKRLRKWYEAVNISYKLENYYGFCASLRGLLEATADTYFTASRVIHPISENHKMIEVALNGKAEVLSTAREVEDALIHYVFARKLSSKQKKESPESHSAKQVRDYIDSLTAVS